MKFYKQIAPFHVDERGEMTYLLDETVKINSVLLITSKKGSIRANHIHKKDSHYAYLLKGSMEYTYGDFEKPEELEKIIVKAGDMVFTPPGEVHAMRFLEDSAFLALTTEKRDQEKYEKDLERVVIVEK